MAHDSVQRFVSVGFLNVVWPEFCCIAGEWKSMNVLVRQRVQLIELHNICDARFRNNSVRIQRIKVEKRSRCCKVFFDGKMGKLNDSHGCRTRKKVFVLGIAIRLRGKRNVRNGYEMSAESFNRVWAPCLI